MEFIRGGVKSILFCNCFMLFLMLAYCESEEPPKDSVAVKVITTSTPLPVLSSKVSATPILPVATVNTAPTPLPVLPLKVSATPILPVATVNTAPTPLPVLPLKVSATPILPVATVTLVSPKSHTTFTLLRLDVNSTIKSMVETTVGSPVTPTVKSTVTSTVMAKTTVESTETTTAKPSAKHSAKPSHHTKMNNTRLVKVFKSVIRMMLARNLTEKAKKILEKAEKAKKTLEKEEKAKKTLEKEGLRPLPSPGTSSDEDSGLPPAGKDTSPGTSHFAVVFLVLIALLFGLYALYHNRQKIIAVVVQGRLSGGRGHHRERYRKLDTKVEPEARIKNSDEVYVY